MSREAEERRDNVFFALAGLSPEDAVHFLEQCAALIQEAGYVPDPDGGWGVK